VQTYSSAKTFRPLSPSLCMSVSAHVQCVKQTSRMSCPPVVLELAQCSGRLAAQPIFLTVIIHKNMVETVAFRHAGKPQDKVGGTGPN
jgi:hypothetical protein